MAVGWCRRRGEPNASGRSSRPLVGQPIRRSRQTGRALPVALSVGPFGGWRSSLDGLATPLLACVDGSSSVAAMPAVFRPRPSLRRRLLQLAPAVLMLSLPVVSLPALAGHGGGHGGGGHGGGGYGGGGYGGGGHRGGLA